MPQYDNRGIRVLPFGAEREMPGRKPVQVYAHELTQDEIVAYLLAIDAKMEGRER